MSDKIKDSTQNFISEADINYLKEKYKKYFFEKGNMVIEGNNISD